MLLRNVPARETRTLLGKKKREEKEGGRRKTLVTPHPVWIEVLRVQHLHKGKTKKSTPKTGSLSHQRTDLNHDRENC